eukprot:1024208-Pleurochrysis_carterae.AAC.1
MGAKREIQYWELSPSAHSGHRACKRLLSPHAPPTGAAPQAPLAPAPALAPSTVYELVDPSPNPGRSL